MITEIRHLLFQTTDLIRALVEYKKKKSECLPPGSISDFRIKRNQGLIHCVLKINLDKSGKKVHFYFEHEEIREALIMYCLYRRVPLPANTNKDLGMFGDRVGLYFSLNLSNEEIKQLQALAG